MDESVELVRTAGLERAVPFANAVLRRLADGMGAFLAGLPEGTPAESALAHSYPDWVAETWWRDLGADGASGAHARPERAERDGRPTRAGNIDGRPDEEVPGAWHVDRVDEGALAEGRSGRRAAARSSSVSPWVRAGERTLDVCAAPGGKATMLQGEVVAVDSNEARVRELEENVRRLGSTSVTVVHADGRALPPELHGFDHALVDAPCSGLGVLASRPDLRWRADPLPDLQLALLRAAAERVRPGGTVVYSVCTINADEAETVVDASGLDVDPSLADEWPAFRHARRPEFLQTLPHVHGTTGFFVARLRVP